MTHIDKKHYVLASLIIACAFIIQPFSLLFIQNNLAPVLAQKLMGQNPDGTVSMEGREIQKEDMKVRGNPDAQIYLVEYSDYQCPFCARFHDIPKQITEASGGKVAWAWKHFPLTAIHPEARPAAIAGECVFRLGGAEKFWSYSDTLIANQGQLSENLYKLEATKLGLNAQQFATCLKDTEVAAEVDKNTAEGEELGVSGTPSTFVVKNENGKLTVLENINGALPKETVESIVSKYTE